MKRTCSTTAKLRQHTYRLCTKQGRAKLCAVCAKSMSADLEKIWFAYSHKKIIKLTVSIL